MGLGSEFTRKIKMHFLPLEKMAINKLINLLLPLILTKGKFN